MGAISKDDPKRWFLVTNNTSGEAGIITFGNLGPVGGSRLTTGNPNVVNYLTEDELEPIVDAAAGIVNYYKDEVESGESRKFSMPSGKYPE